MFKKLVLALTMACTAGAAMATDWWTIKSDIADLGYEKPFQAAMAVNLHYTIKQAAPGEERMAAWMNVIEVLKDTQAREARVAQTVDSLVNFEYGALIDSEQALELTSGLHTADVSMVEGQVAAHFADKTAGQHRDTCYTSNGQLGTTVKSINGFSFFTGGYTYSSGMCAVSSR